MPYPMLTLILNRDWLPLLLSMISGFMIVKNVLGQGYPFVEAIASALPICDEFLISDGYSTDGTYETIQKIATLNPKVKIFQQQWPSKKSVNVLTDVTNTLRKKCRFQHIFSVQANEIIHEENIPFIKSLPKMLPYADTFSFPYLQLLNYYKLTEEFRLRFAKNLPRIEAIDDGWTLGISKSFERAKKLKCFAYPPRLSGYIRAGIMYTYANIGYTPHSRAIYLPKPVYRYWALFPKNFIQKYEGHRQLFALESFKDSIDNLKLYMNDLETFWRLSYETLNKTLSKERPQYLESYKTVEKKNHPAVIQEFISNPNVDKYYVR